MKRYMVLSHHFDTRATLLAMQIGEDWAPTVKEQYAVNKAQLRAELIDQYGALNAEVKLQNFMDIGPIPFSVIAFHSRFLEQARDAFVVGAYYPCLVACCALGERILNHLVLALRNYYADTEGYRKVHKKASFDNWTIAIDALDGWDVLRPDVTSTFRELHNIRNRAIHFKPETDRNDRAMALNAFQRLSSIVEGQFRAIGPQPWYIRGVVGAAFVKKEYETHPFVKEVILPNCQFVGYRPRLELNDETGAWMAIDDGEYEGEELSDEEFRDRFNQRTLPDE